MAYYIQLDKTIKVDTPEEALELIVLLGELGSKTSEPKTSEPEPGIALTSRIRRRRPSVAVKYGVKIGQIYEKYSGPSAGRTIQIVQLLPSGIIPRVVKNASKSARKSVNRKLSYKVLRSAYRLVEDV